jgi:hypothetical protein
MSEREYLINEAQMLLLAMKAETNAGERVRAEMIAIIKAWKRGRLLPATEAPMLEILYGEAPFIPSDPGRPPGHAIRVVK